MQIEFTTRQVRSLARDLSKAPAEARKRASTAIRKTALDIEHDAKVLVPVDTGFLKNSIGHSIGDAGLSAEVGPTAEYGIYVEQGTSRMSPEPYLAPAFDRRAPGLAKALAQVADEIL